jgi:hypothetical protein
MLAGTRLHIDGGGSLGCRARRGIGRAVTGFGPASLSLDNTTGYAETGVPRGTRRCVRRAGDRLVRRVTSGGRLILPAEHVLEEIEVTIVGQREPWRRNFT